MTYRTITDLATDLYEDGSTPGARPDERYILAIGGGILILDREVPCYDDDRLHISDRIVLNLNTLTEGISADEYNIPSVIAEMLHEIGCRI